MDVSTLQFSQAVVHEVDEEGQVGKEISRSEGRYSCEPCGTSWAESAWEEAALHCLTEHAKPARKSKSKK